MSAAPGSGDAGARPTQRGRGSPAAAWPPHAFSARRTVRFAACDPAGIVFYPRFFEILDDVKEEFFATVLGQPIHLYFRDRRRGFPIARLETDFLAPSYHGDMLEVGLAIRHVGRTSVRMDYRIACGGQPRLQARTVIVFTDLADGRPVPLDPPLREALQRCVADPAVQDAR